MKKRVSEVTPEEFQKFWLEKDYRIYRYGGADGITYAPDPFLPLEEDGPLPEAKINRALMTDYGNKANYRLGEPVRITVFRADCDAVSVEAPDGTAARVPVEEGKCMLSPEKPGFYRAQALCGDADRPLETADIGKTNSLMYAAASLMLALCLAAAAVILFSGGWRP